MKERQKPGFRCQSRSRHAAEFPIKRLNEKKKKKKKCSGKICTCRSAANEATMMHNERNEAGR